MKILRLLCKRCGHSWIPRSEKSPKFCPKCNSPYWQTERKHPLGINLGVLNGQWKGDEVSNGKLHAWLRRNLPKPIYCEHCKTAKPYEVTCKTGIYNRDFSNWAWLCRRCHMLSDGRFSNLKQNKT